MLRLLLPLVLVLAIGLIRWKFSVRALSRSLDANSFPLDEPEIEGVVRRLGRAVEVPTLRAYVYDVQPFNGLAAPDGRVFVTRGVIDKFKLGLLSAEEVGSIIAHELGHVALGHSRRRMIDWGGQNAVRWILFAILGRFIPFVGFWIANLVASLVAAKLSRRDEFEADAFAAAMMRKAGLPREAQITMFRKLGRMTPRGQAPAWLMSHPDTGERIAAIERLHEEWDARRPVGGQGRN